MKLPEAPIRFIINGQQIWVPTILLSTTAQLSDALARAKEWTPDNLGWWRSSCGAVIENTISLCPECGDIIPK